MLMACSITSLALQFLACATKTIFFHKLVDCLIWKYKVEGKSIVGGGTGDFIVLPKKINPTGASPVGSNCIALN